MAARFYVPAYDGLRFVLLLGVLEYHYCLHRLPIERFWFLTYALCCFFVLSGFLITHLLLRSEAAGGPSGRKLMDFYIRRGLRVFPAYYVVLLVSACFLSVPYLGWQLTYLLNFKLFWLSLQPSAEFLGYMAGWRGNGVHLWSMAVEEQFYLLYPLLLWCSPRGWRGWLLGLGLALCIGCRLWLMRAFPDSCYGALTPVPGEYLLWGCWLAWLDFSERAGWLRGRVAFYGAFLVLLLLFGLDPDVQRYEYAQWRPPAHQTLYALALGLVVLGLRHHPRSWLTRALSWGPLVRLGKISYGTYLVHLFLSGPVERLPLPPALGGPLLSLAVAGLMWVTFEERANRAKDWLAPVACEG
ncbi:MAG: acyltransferase [Candidatus Eremiobacteraeota bacterium]|nr:acyltransferase [Candidatus Eremiobacteraeota bacterium]